MSVELRQHPLSALWPPMAAADFAALLEDIRAHGQHDAGVIYDGQVLDGWHRYRACLELGLKFKAEEFNGDDPATFVISKNGRRRHVSASVLAVSAAACMEWRPRGGDQTAPGAVRSGTTVKEAADAVGVGERTMERAKAVVKAGLTEQVATGAISLKDAERVARLPKAKREKAVKAIAEGDEPKLPKPKADSKDVEKLRAELIDLQGKYADLLEKNNELADVAREVNDKLEMFETTEPDEQQKLIAELQKKLRRKEGEIERQRGVISDLNNKCNALIRQVKSMQRKAA